MVTIGDAAYGAFLLLETVSCAAAGREIRVIDGHQARCADFSNWRPGANTGQK